jgi:hypothetical protein
MSRDRWNYGVPIRCPYYIDHSRLEPAITCQGAGVTMTQRFPSMERRDARMQDSCCKYMPGRRPSCSCLLARVMDAYHDRKGTAPKRRIVRVEVKVKGQVGEQMRFI